MLLKELLQYTYDNISLYIEKDIGEYETVFTGNKKDIPEKYLLWMWVDFSQWKKI